MGKISKDVIEKIKKSDIKPIPKWQFLLKDSFLWILSVVNIIFGSIGFGIIIYLLRNNDMVSEIRLANNFFEWIVFALPLLWILFTVVFLFISFYYFKNTEEGYRFNAVKILLFSTLISILFGSVLYTSGTAEKLNDIFGKNVPYYKHTMDVRNAMWSRPDEGFLGGNILSIDSEERILVLKDFNGVQWNIKYNNALIRGRVSLSVGEGIKVLGESGEGNVFIAKEIRPLVGRGMRRMQEK
jgi:hypothetical protein